jgi:nucleoside-diphosphate-sugar epimerase
MATLIFGVGFIGSALAAELLRSGERVVGFDNLFATDARALDQLRRHGNFELVEGDVADPAAVARAFEVEPIELVHLLAAQASAHPSAATPEYTERTNLAGPRVVVEECIKRGVARLVFGGSLRVYGQPLPPRFDEATPYGRQHDLSHLSKVYAEKLLEMRAADGAIGVVSARLAIVYGLSPVIKRDPLFMTVPNRFALQARRGEPLRVASGAGALSLLHVTDAVQGLLRCAELAAPGYEPVNVLGEWMTVPELARVVVEEATYRGLDARAVGPTTEMAVVPDGRSRLDAVEFQRSRDVRGGVRELIDYFLADVG